MLTAERLRELVHYDPETGEFFSKRTVGRCDRWKSGRPMGCLDKQSGYRKIYVGGALHYQHRLAWLYVHGRWPEKHLDHINMDRSDNRISNLRECDDSLNMANARAKPLNRSGLKGVTAHKDGRWRAQIMRNRRQIYLGLFATKEEAAAAYEKAAQELVGEFARTA